MGGGGVKGFLNNVKKTVFFLHDGFPLGENLFWRFCVGTSGPWNLKKDNQTNTFQWYFAKLPAQYNVLLAPQDIYLQMEQS